MEKDIKTRPVPNPNTIKPNCLIVDKATIFYIFFI